MSIGLVQGPVELPGCRTTVGCRGRQNGIGRKLADPKPLQCIGYISWHAEGHGVGCRIQVSGDAYVFGAIPIDRNGIHFLEGLDEVVRVLS